MFHPSYLWAAFCSALQTPSSRVTWAYLESPSRPCCSMQMVWAVLRAWCQHTVLLCKADVMLSFQGRLFAEAGTLLIVLLMRLSRYLSLFSVVYNLNLQVSFQCSIFGVLYFLSWVKCCTSHFCVHAEGSGFVPALSVCTAGTVGHKSQEPGRAFSAGVHLVMVGKAEQFILCSLISAGFFVCNQSSLKSWSWSALTHCSESHENNQKELMAYMVDPASLLRVRNYFFFFIAFGKAVVKEMCFVKMVHILIYKYRRSHWTFESCCAYHCRSMGNLCFLQFLASPVFAFWWCSACT